MKVSVLKFNPEFKGVFIVNAGWGFQSNTQDQGGLVHEKLGLFFYLIEVQGVLVNGRLGPSNPTQPNLKGVF
jgi:hypothetical protein